MAANTEFNVEYRDDNINKVNQYFLLDTELLPQDKIITLASVVIKNRAHYSHDTIGRVFILLAEVAENKGDIGRSFQFAIDGFALTGISRTIKLNLMLKISAGHYVKGKYHSVLNVAEQAIQLSSDSDSEFIEYRLIALSYKAMAHALLGQHNLAFESLQRVESLIEQYKQFTDHFELLEILASAYHYQGRYQTAVIMYNKLIKLRFDSSRTKNIDQTYYSLASAHLALTEFDDAYNAFWEAKKYALKKSAAIRIAYAELGLGQVLLLQNEYQAAYLVLFKAEDIFKGQNLTKPYLSSLIALAKVSQKVNKIDESHELLIKAQYIAENVDLTKAQFELYLLLSKMYYRQGNVEGAFKAQSKYLELYDQINTANKLYNPNLKKYKQVNDDSRYLAMKLLDQSGHRTAFSGKIAYQKRIIFWLTIALSTLLVILGVFLIKRRKIQQNKKYDEVEQSDLFLSTPFLTKKTYQQSYKKARKYEYSLAVGYLLIDNWKELNFRFSKKVISEIFQIMEVLFTENMEEFDHAGLINEGEYLILCPHQSSDDLESKLIKLSEALKVQFIANIGSFSVKISYAFDTPNIQDIDPYIFLSRLSEKKLKSANNKEDV
jgi:tetratricopeptide (TPR) repeat protein